MRQITHLVVDTGLLDTALACLCRGLFYCGESFPCNLKGLYNFVARDNEAVSVNWREPILKELLSGCHIPAAQCNAVLSRWCGTITF